MQRVVDRRDQSIDLDRRDARGGALTRLRGSERNAEKKHDLFDCNDSIVVAVTEAGQNGVGCHSPELVAEPEILGGEIHERAGANEGAERLRVGGKLRHSSQPLSPSSAAKSSIPLNPAMVAE
jgi:hypothetical protein